MRTRKFPTFLLALALLVALLVAGCGGGGDDTTAETRETTAESRPTPTRAELISQGDAICGEVNAAIGAIGADEEGDVEEQTTQVASLYVGMIDSLQALGRPTEAEGYDEFWAAAEEFAKVEGEVKLAAERGDPEALGEAATAAAPALEEFQAQAAIYGMEECSEQPSAPVVGGTGGEAEGGGEIEEGGVEVTPEIEEVLPEEEVAPEEEIAPEEGGGIGGEEVAPEGGSEESGSGGGIGPG